MFRSKSMRNFFAVCVIGLALVFVSPVRANTIAFGSPGGLSVGSGNVNLGLLFDVNTPIMVNALGFYGGNGIFAGETVAIYDLSQNLLASADVLLSDPVEDGYFFHSITPISLSAGNQYIVVAFTNGNNWSYTPLSSPPTVTDPSITFAGSQYIFSSLLQYPTETYPADYFGPNFAFSSPTSPVPEPTSLLLLGMGLGALGVAAWRRKK
jgi:hypothetical protein